MEHSGSPAQTQEEVLKLTKRLGLQDMLERMFGVDLAAPVEAQTQEKILAQCWPTLTTSDIPETPPPPRPDMLTLDGRDEVTLERDRVLERFDRMFKRSVSGSESGVQEERLGDLKLYRVPELSSLASRQMKQVRLLDRGPVPVTLLYVGYESAMNELAQGTARVLRTRNDTAHHLGIPLPAGRISTFTEEEETPVLLAESDLRDISVGESFEIDAGQAADVQVRSVEERRLSRAAAQIPLLPGIDVRTAIFEQVFRIEVTNARRSAITFEARLEDDTQLLRSTVTPFLRDGWHVMRVQVPPGGTATIRYQTGRRVSRVVRHH